MKTKTTVGLLAAGLVGLSTVAALPAQAAAPSGFVGDTASSVPGCPYISWRLVNSANGQIHGIAMYSDLSGLSNVTGTMQPDGTFTLTLTKTTIGDGPVGTVSGKRYPDGDIVATLKGEGCANNMVDIKSVNNMMYPPGVNTGGGGR